MYELQRSMCQVEQSKEKTVRIGESMLQEISI